MKADKVIEKVIREKKIYIVKNHHEVLIPWSEYASNNNAAPVLITLDHHADTRSSFYRYANEVAGSEWKAMSNQMTTKANIKDQSAIMTALERLRNNEHIDFALQTGMLSDAVVLSMLGIGVCTDYVNSKIYYIDPCCTRKCNKNVHDDSCQIDVYDKVIESEELLYKLNQINRFVPGFFDSNEINMKYILDIDLDCFHTKKAIQPVGLSIFSYLVKHAEIITIATEEEYVELEKIDEDISMKDLLQRLLLHIENALESK